jgi:hypothetical protein
MVIYLSQPREQTPQLAFHHCLLVSFRLSLSSGGGLIRALGCYYLLKYEKETVYMTKQTTIKLSIILAIVAAALAFSASLIDYLRRGKINLTPILGTLFLLALAFFLSRSKG